MPNRVPWSPSYNVGHPLVDSQHQALLAHCHALADLFEAGAYANDEARFDERFQRLMELAREHFASESSLLERHAYRALDELQDEYDEFEFLADKILTADKFDRLEIQRFMTWWVLGHIKGTVEKQRACFSRDAPSASTAAD